MLKFLCCGSRKQDEHDGRSVHRSSRYQNDGVQGPPQVSTSKTESLDDYPPAPQVATTAPKPQFKQTSGNAPYDEAYDCSLQDRCTKGDTQRIDYLRPSKKRQTTQQHETTFSTDGTITSNYRQQGLEPICVTDASNTSQNKARDANPTKGRVRSAVRPNQVGQDKGAFSSVEQRRTDPGQLDVRNNCKTSSSSQRSDGHDSKGGTGTELHETQDVACDGELAAEVTKDPKINPAYQLHDEANGRGSDLPSSTTNGSNQYLSPQTPRASPVPGQDFTDSQSGDMSSDASDGDKGQPRKQSESADERATASSDPSPSDLSNEQAESKGVNSPTLPTANPNQCKHCSSECSAGKGSTERKCTCMPISVEPQSMKWIDRRHTSDWNRAQSQVDDRIETGATTLARCERSGSALNADTSIQGSTTSSSGRSSGDNLWMSSPPWPNDERQTQSETCENVEVSPDEEEGQLPKQSGGVDEGSTAYSDRSSSGQSDKEDEGQRGKTRELPTLKPVTQCCQCTSASDVGNASTETNCTCIHSSIKHRPTEDWTRTSRISHWDRPQSQHAKRRYRWPEATTPVGPNMLGLVSRTDSQIVDWTISPSESYMSSLQWERSSPCCFDDKQTTQRDWQPGEDARTHNFYSFRQQTNSTVPSPILSRKDNNCSEILGDHISRQPHTSANNYQLRQNDRSPNSDFAANSDSRTLGCVSGGQIKFAELNFPIESNKSDSRLKKVWATDQTSLQARQVLVIKSKETEGKDSAGSEFLKLEGATDRQENHTTILGGKPRFFRKDTSFDRLPSDRQLYEKESDHLTTERKSKRMDLEPDGASPVPTTSTLSGSRTVAVPDTGPVSGQYHVHVCDPDLPSIPSPQVNRTRRDASIADSGSENTVQSADSMRVNASSGLSSSLVSSDTSSHSRGSRCRRQRENLVFDGGRRQTIASSYSEPSFSSTSNPLDTNKVKAVEEAGRVSDADHLHVNAPSQAPSSQLAVSTQDAAPTSHPSSNTSSLPRGGRMFQAAPSGTLSIISADRSSGQSTLSNPPASNQDNTGSYDPWSADYSTS